MQFIWMVRWRIYIKLVEWRTRQRLNIREILPPILNCGKFLVMDKKKISSLFNIQWIHKWYDKWCHISHRFNDHYLKPVNLQLKQNNLWIVALKLILAFSHLTMEQSIIRVSSIFMQFFHESFHIFVFLLHEPCTLL